MPARPRFLVPDVLHGEERLLEADRGRERLPGRPVVARLEGVPPPDLPAVEAHLPGEHVERALHREVRLVRAEAAHRPAGRVVRVDGQRLDVEVRAPVRPGRVSRRALEHLGPDRRVRARVADHPRADGREAPLGVTARAEVDRDRVALRVEAHGFLAREDELDGLPRHAGQQRGLRLDRQVLLASERAAVRDEDDVHLVLGEREERRDLPPVVEDALPLRVERETGPRILAGRVARNGDAGFGLEVQVLDALRPPRPLDDVGRRRERRLGVAASHDRPREEVALRAHARRSRAQRLLGVGHGRQDLVVDVDERRRRAGRARVDGRDRGEDVADAVRFLPFGHEPRPVRDDEAVEAAPRHVLRGHDRQDARVARRARRVDPQDAGACVRRERDGAVEHPGKREVRDEGAYSERERSGLISLEARPDAARLVRRLERLSSAQARRRVKRLDDPDVPRAAAEVGIQPLPDLLVGRVRIRVEDALHPQDDPRDAEAALEARRPRERFGVDPALFAGHALERQDALPGGRAGGHGARHLRVPVDEHEARAALALRRAAVLGRRETRVVAEQLEERGVGGDVELPGGTVERQLDVHNRTFSEPRRPPGMMQAHVCSSA